MTHSKLLHTASLYCTKNALTVNTQQAFTQTSFYTKKAFTHRKLLHTESFTHSKLLHTQPRRQATFKQPLHCVLQHHVATRISLRTWQQNVTPIMQPFHCDLQPQLRNYPLTTLRTHEQPLAAEHRGGTDSTMKRPQP